MGADKGFKKSEGFNQDDNMENERGKTGPEDHGWAPDSGPTSEPNRRAGEKSFEKPDHEPDTKMPTPVSEQGVGQGKGNF